MSTVELIQMAALVAVVIIIAYVARRSQTVGLPPGVKKEGEQDGQPSEAEQQSAPENGTRSQQAGGGGRERKSKR